MKESPPQPPTQPTTKQLTFQLPGGCLGDDKEHYTPHPHTTNPQHNTTKHTNRKQKKGPHTRSLSVRSIVGNETVSPRVKAVS
ncbi:hypothetical protein ckrop_0087 [Corynebacterium kroppenstedtii DSM 44385]|uniref:Uncharacterized protein n=1 Tax=Corynebacterium kroppenstedtii (strain DSM 44385 / JCM 11950 / CIP 105744 / CCUG 35717) TaxID=645127 RepID=C4LG48_CORK4|nr:hypothetical protein ckrop_0087 [Corynebacterium kroppenstedtii DSM 44385]